MDKKEHMEMVKEILNWLKSSQMVDYTGGHENISHGLPPTYLIIELKDKTIIQIKSSVNAIITQLPNGTTEVKGQIVDGQVTIYIGDTMNYIRVLSPELKSFIDSGWMHFFNYNN
jgi:hypothetical protein